MKKSKNDHPIPSFPVCGATWAVFSSLLLAIAGMSSAFADPPREKPNVIFILTDDQGYGDLACHGNPIIKTPSLDKLYNESLRFTDFHMDSVCAPSRGALMTGMYPSNNGAYSNLGGLDFVYHDIRMMPEAFKAGGYATAMFGKWHLGANYPHRPEDRGFDEVVRLGGGGVGQTPDVWDNAYFDDRYYHNGKIEQYKGYCTDVFFDETKRFISECSAKKKPFFIYLSPNAPHGPMLCPEKYYKPYLEKIAELPAFSDERSLKIGRHLITAIFYGMITNIDDNIGELRDFLKENGLDKDTLLVFAGDNGSAHGALVFNAAMRGSKAKMYDGGHRVACFLHWPGGGLDKGRDCDALTAHIDFLPTFIDWFDLKGFGSEYKFDGTSLVPHIEEPNKSLPGRTIFTGFASKDPERFKKQAIMREKWRLVVDGEKKELYEVGKDIGQNSNVYERYPEIAKRLEDDFAALCRGFKRREEYFSRIIIGNRVENPVKLNAMDVHRIPGSGVPWNQSSVRGGYPGYGPWQVHVETSGRYKVSLRRWPKEADREIRGDLPAGKPVEGRTAPREIPGVALDITKAGVSIDGTELVKDVTDESKVITFELALEAGAKALEAWFQLARPAERNKKMFPRIFAYYVEVEKL